MKFLQQNWCSLILWEISKFCMFLSLNSRNFFSLICEEPFSTLLPSPILDHFKVAWAHFDLAPYWYVMALHTLLSISKKDNTVKVSLQLLAWEFETSNQRFIQTEIYVTLIQLIMENVIHWFRHFSYCIPTISFKFKNPMTNIIPKEIQVFTVGLHHLCFCPQLRLMDLAGLEASWQIAHLALS